MLSILPNKTSQRGMFAILKNNSVDNILLSYILTRFSDFVHLDADCKSKIRHLFELRLENRIRTTEFVSAAKTFSESIASAASVLVTALENPRALCSDKSSYVWTDNETVLLLLGVKLENRLIHKHFLPSRSEEACRRRLQRVVEEHEHCDGQAQRTLVHGDSFTVGHDGRVKRLKEQLADCRRVVVAQKRQMQVMSTKIARLSKTVKRLEKMLEEVESIEPDEPNDDVDTLVTPTLRAKVLGELNELDSSHSIRKTYTPDLLRVAHLLSLTSRRGYKLVRQLLPLPSETCLWNHFGQSVAKTRQLLTDPSMLKEHIESLLELTSEQKPHMVTIGIDAFTFRTFHDVSIFKSTKPQEFSHGFVFLHIPVDSELPVKVLHIARKRNGNYDEEISNIFKQIVEIYKAKKIKIWFKSTDGDRYLGQEHEEFFEDHVSFRRHDFPTLVDTLYDSLQSSDEVMPIADPLHFGKNLRGKLLDHNVAVVLNDGEPSITNASILQGALQIGSTLDDHTQLGRMRDFYVANLFTLDNVCRLLEAELFDAAFMLFPYACIFTLIYAENLLNQTRFLLAHLAFLAFDRLYAEARDLSAAGVGVRYRYVSGARAVTVAEPDYFRRMMHTCIAFGLVIAHGPDRVRLDSIGTHLVENAIGLARTTSNSTDYDKIISAFANSEMRKQLAADLDIKIHVQRRINDGGAKIDTLSDDGIKHPDWDPRDVVSVLHEACKASFRESSTSEREKLIAEMGEFVKAIKMRRLTAPSSVANALILERNFKYATSSTSKDEVAQV